MGAGEGGGVGWTKTLLWTDIGDNRLCSATLSGVSALVCDITTFLTIAS